MVRCRIGYLLTLLGAVGLFLFFDGYFSFYFLVLVLALPLFSLLVSLPGIVGAKAGFAASARTIRRGEGFALRLTLETRFHFPVARFSARIRCRNLLTGEESLLKRKGGGGDIVLAAEVEELHCGLVRCAAEKLRICDLLGIFSFRLKSPEGVEVLSLPLDLPPEEAPVLLGEGEKQVAMKPRPGGGPGEDYDLRSYRSGDPLRSVHWKLSSKLDKLVVRETLEPLKVQAILTYDHRGAPEELDAVFDRLDALARGLIGRERALSVRWRDPISGETVHKTVHSLNDLRAFEHAAFSTPAPQRGRGALPAPLSGDTAESMKRWLHLGRDGTGGGVV